MPAREPSVSEEATLRVPGELMVRAIESLNALPFLMVKEPALIVDAPLKVFVPASVSSPTPSFVNVELPAMGPLKAMELARLRVESVRSEPEPVKVSVPEVDASPKARLPDSLKKLARK